MLVKKAKQKGIELIEKNIYEVFNFSYYWNNNWWGSGVVCSPEENKRVAPGNRED